MKEKDGGEEGAGAGGWGSPRGDRAIEEDVGGIGSLILTSTLRSTRQRKRIEERDSGQGKQKGVEKFEVSQFSDRPVLHWEFDRLSLLHRVHLQEGGEGP